MKRLAWLTALGCAFSMGLGAASIDGKWVAEVRSKAGKKQGGGEQIAKFTLDLKSSDGKLTGTISSPGRRRDRTMTITDGKIDGDAISFTTIQKSKKAERKLLWRGTLRGDELTGTRGREGARRGESFTAKRG